MIAVDVRNDSACKRLVRRDVLEGIAQRVARGENLRAKAEISVLLCDDPKITELNWDYRRKNKPTDVLSFAQPILPGARVRLLGDIIISLETVHRYCAGDRKAMAEEVRLLFCHGMLHLLGYVHSTEAERAEMIAKQAQYLRIPETAAWRNEAGGLS